MKRIRNFERRLIKDMVKNGHPTYTREDTGERYVFGAVRDTDGDKTSYMYVDGIPAEDLQNEIENIEGIGQHTGAAGCTCRSGAAVWQVGSHGFIALWRTYLDI